MNDNACSYLCVRVGQVSAEFAKNGRLKHSLLACLLAWLIEEAVAAIQLHTALTDKSVIQLPSL